MCLGNHTPRGQPFGGCFPSNPPQDGPPNLGIARICRGVFLVELLPIFTDLYGLSWAIILVNSRVVFTVDYLYYIHVFFSGIVLWRNYLINRVELFEDKSILVFPECLEAA